MTVEIETVFDATVLSNFAHVDRIGLLCRLSAPVTTTAVERELRNGAERYDYLSRAVNELGDGITVVTPPQERETLAFSITLDDGEAEALAVAESADATIVTDDGEARTVAKRRETDVTGSIGLLVRFVRRDELPVETADRYLTRWIDERGFRAPARDLREFL